MDFFRKRFTARDMLILMLLTLLFSKIIMVHNFLPAKYFYDADTLASRCIYSYEFDSEPFAWLYHCVNIFGFSNRNQWEVVLTLIGNVLLFCTFFYRHKQDYSIDEVLTILCIVVLSNVYIFQISKDFWQLLFFYCLALIARSKIRFYLKVLVIFALLFGEGIYFREYYKLTALMFVLLLLLFLFTIFLPMKVRIIMILGSILICFSFAKSAMPDEFIEVVNVRDSLTTPKDGSVDSVTLIKNLFSNSNSILTFYLNYFINFFRICIPVELLPKGLFYVPFFIFQILIISKLKEEYSIALSFNKECLNQHWDYVIILGIIFAYFCVAVIFEPDFGSVVRHEVALYPFIFYLYRTNNSVMEDKT